MIRSMPVVLLCFVHKEDALLHFLRTRLSNTQSERFHPFHNCL
jgi:hypothetical protein